MTIAGGTGIDSSATSNTVTLAIDSTVATLTGTQTLTNKTLTAPVISTITNNSNTLTLPTTADTLVGRATTDTLTNKTITSPSVSGLTLTDSSIVFEGATADAYETTLTVVDPTADRTITFQNGTGTVAFLSDVTGGATPGNFTTITLDNNITFEGDTDDAYETTLTVIDPTADRTVSIPNATGQIVLRDTTDTLTNKSIDLANNTLTGSLAEFNSALQSESFAGLAATQTLTNKTISGADNTLSNIANSSLTNSSITISDGSNTSAVALGGTLTISGTSNEITVAESSGTVTISQPDDVTICLLYTSPSPRD